MAKPKTIKIRGPRELEIKVVGFKKKSCIPFLYVKKGNKVYGYIEDLDVKRLHAWCEYILKNIHCKISIAR